MVVKVEDLESILNLIVHENVSKGLKETSCSYKRYSLIAKLTKAGITIRCLDTKTRDVLPMELKW